MATLPQSEQRPSTGNAPPAQRREPQRAPDERTVRDVREERILDAAAALLVRWGYRKTTIDDVAREAGVGKGTIYLHWKDKSELFRAAIWRASQQATDDVVRRIAADPEGGQFHRLWTHGLLSVLENPLMAALMQGKPDILQGLMDTMTPETLNQLAGNATDHLAQLQSAGLIRADVSIPTITYLMGALKIGIIQMPEIMGQMQPPAMEELAAAISDLVRRWLEPEHLPSDSNEGKHLMVDWMERANEIASQE